MGVLILAAAITAIFVKADTGLSKLVCIGIILAGFFLLPPRAFIVAPVAVFIGLIIKEKLDDARGS
jgi:hypothetical protein